MQYYFTYMSPNLWPVHGASKDFRVRSMNSSAELYRVHHMSPVSFLLTTNFNLMCSSTTVFSQLSPLFWLPLRIVWKVKQSRIDICGAPGRLDLPLVAMSKFCPQQLYFFLCSIWSCHVKAGAFSSGPPEISCLQRSKVRHRNLRKAFFATRRNF